MALFKKLVDLVLYSNLWIALGALCLTLQSRWILVGTHILTPLDGFILSATLFVYAIHRLIALQRQKGELANQRFRTIARHRLDISLYTLASAIAAAIFFVQLSRPVQISALFPAFLSVLYVLPVFKGQRRLRDFNYLKIFLVATVWAWVTVILPAKEQFVLGFVPTWLMTLERFLFVFAITIPFDIRDLYLDKAAEVRTLPARVGSERAKQLSLLLLILASLIAIFLFRLDAYSFPMLAGWIITTLLAIPLILKARPDRTDYYYSGYLDGLLIVQFLLMYTLNSLGHWK